MSMGVRNRQTLHIPPFDDYAKTLGQWLREFGIANRLGPTTVAEWVGLSSKATRKIMTGKTKTPRLSTVGTIAEALFPRESEQYTHFLQCFGQAPSTFTPKNSLHALNSGQR